MTGLRAATAGNQVKVSWNAVNGADGYVIYRKIDKEKTLQYMYIVGKEVRTWTDVKPVKGKTNFYFVVPYSMVNGNRVIKSPKPYAYAVVTESTDTGNAKAINRAKYHLNRMAFSYNRLVDQLKEEGFSPAEAKYGVDNCGANWYYQAYKASLEYFEFTAFSKIGLIEQLEYEEFTKEQATYAANNCGADWNEQAVRKAKQHLQEADFTRERLIDQLVFEGFTHSQAIYGVEQNGL